MAKLAALCLAFVAVSGIISTSDAAANVIDIYKNVVFDYAVMKNPKPVIVFYYSSRKCTACLWSIKPMLERMVKRKSDKVYLALVDFDKVPDLEYQHGITDMPTTRVYYKGQVLDSVEGLSWARLVPLVNAATKII